jgi:ActR/RegA family two-component response regulator
MKRFRCACGKEIFFDNTRCLHCNRDVGFSPRSSDLMVHAQSELYATTTEVNAPPAGGLRACQNAAIGICNWLIDPKLEGDAVLCRACRLTRVVPDLSLQENVQRLGEVEAAKRRLLFGLMTLGVPVPSKDDDANGLTFQILAEVGEEKVVIGHSDGVITIALREADPVHRERERCRLGESYRTVLGHLRHEVGHFYFDRLIANSGRLDEFRALFGDEREDYSAALERHYGSGPPADWRDRFVSAYASSHPWEDWAETWAHYLHACDAVQTATEHGVHDETDATASKRIAAVLAGKRLTAPQFKQFVETWTRTATVLNELNRSLGAHEPYPFVLPGPVVDKLHFVHETVRLARDAGALTTTGSLQGKPADPEAPVPAPAAMQHQTPQSQPSRPSDAPPRESMEIPSQLRVLMIDDSSEFASPIAMSLQNAGYQVRVCADGTSGLIALEQFAPRVILLDMELPDMHGLQLAAAARSAGYSGVLIGLSARCDDALMSRIPRSGLDQFVSKPCDITELQRMVSELAADRESAPLASNG